MKIFKLCRCCLSRRGDDIVGIFQKIFRSIKKTCFFGTAHRMTANKIRFYIQSSYSFVDIAFDTADIGNDAGGFDDRFQFL